MVFYYTLHEKIRNLAFLSRVSVLLLQVVANWVIPDHQADAFVSPTDPEMPVGIGDTIVDGLFGGLLRWDAQYFVHIAEYGYTHENTLAFFPFYPLIVRVFANFINVPLQLFLNYHSIIILSAILLNFYLFVKATEAFYRLSREVLRDEILAYRAAVLFCVNPASIFFSAPYSETVFAFCTFSALLNYERGGGWAAPAHFGLAAASRSNGLVNIGFVLYHKLRHCATYYYRLRGPRNRVSGTLSIVLVLLLTFNYTLVPLFFASFSVLAPFMLYQAWCYMTYCGDEAGSSLPNHLESYVRSNFLHSPDMGEAEWCYAAVPLAYAHVQDKYWEVGLFRYYELRQLPNFLLAVPVVLMMICHAALYFVDNPQVVCSLGIPQPEQIEPKKKAASATLNKDDHHEISKTGSTTKAKKKILQQSSNTDDANIDDEAKSRTSAAAVAARELPSDMWCSVGLGSWRVFVYTVHGLAICFFCLLFINVQVTTRLVCSSCPVVYWFAAHLITANSEPANSSAASPKRAASRRPETSSNMEKRFRVELLAGLPSTFWGQVVMSYFLLYFFLGTILFSNFLPWT